MQTQLVTLLAASNAGGVWYGSEPKVEMTGWLVLGAVVAVVLGLCWLAGWAVRRSVSGEEARSENRAEIDRLTGGAMQSYRQ